MKSIIAAMTILAFFNTGQGAESQTLQDGMESARKNFETIFKPFTEQPVIEEPEEYEPKPTPKNITDNTMHSWWFTRNKTHTPPSAQTAINLSEYDAYYLGDTSQKVIYLTFDEGYENGYTERILDILKENDVQAAFFVTKQYIEANADLCKRMIEEGHMVGNHTATHPSLPNVTEEKMRGELQTTEDKFLELTGYKMSKVMRPPQGDYSRKSLYVTMSMGYKTFFWSFAYGDWDQNKQPSTAYAYSMIMEGSHPGAVYLLHAVSKSNTEVLDRVIKDLKKEGYTFSLLKGFN